MKKNSKLYIALVVLLVLGSLLWGNLDPSGEAQVTQSPSLAVVDAAPTPASTAKPGPSPTAAPIPTASPTPTAAPLDEHGSYTTAEDVAQYLITYGHLPENFITKSEAEAAGWNGGSLEPYCPGKCIGGDRFGNREGLLPSAKGRSWTECDINTLGARSRGAERLVFSNDGLIYYTGDHYESFTLLYGNP